MKKSHIYKPALDWWGALIAGGALFILLAAIPVVAWADFSLGVTSIITFVLIFFALYIVDMLAFTHYRLDDEGLVIQSQLRKIVFPYRHIKHVREGGLLSLISLFGHKRYALSRKSFVIHMHKGMWRSISVSPKKRQQFLDELQDRLELTNQSK